MNNNKVEYIKNNMQDIRLIMKRIEDLSMYIKLNKYKNDMYFQMVNNYNELKLLLFSYLLSGNFDNIVESTSTSLKEDLINNKIKKRVKSSIIFEEGQDFEIDAGLRIINISPKMQNDSDKIINTIRNSIAHSKYEMVNDDVHILNRDFEALVSVGWIEQMTLGLFSNHASQSSKNGVYDYLYFDTTYNNVFIKNEKDLRKIIKSFFKIKFTINSNGEKLGYTGQSIAETLHNSFVYTSKIFYKIKEDFKDEKEANRQIKIELTNILNIIRKDLNNSFDYEIETVKDDFLTEFNGLYNIIYNRPYNTQLQNAIISKKESFKNPEKRNSIALKKTMEFIELTEQYETSDLFEYDIVYYLDMCYQFLFKAYMNLAFNYTKEQSKIPFDFTNSNIKIILPNYVDIRKQEINAKKALLLTSNGQQVTDLNNKITKLLDEINDYKNKSLDFNKIYTEKMRNALAHDNVNFRMITDISECTFIDEDSGVINFKATGKVEDFMNMADQYITLIENQIQK